MFKNKRIDYNYIFIILFCSLPALIILFSGNVFGSELDWLAQHVAIPEYFRNLFYETHDLFPSFAFSLGAGQNIYNFSYYGLYNPLIIISYLFPFIKMSTYICIMNIVLYNLLGCLLYYFFKRRSSKRISLITTIILLCASPLLFHFHRHYMFVSYLPFLVLGMIGVDDYIENNNISLVGVSVFLIIMISYYYSITSIIVLGVYAIYRYLEYNNNIKFKSIFKSGIIFLIPIVLGILSASILLLPTANTIILGRDHSNSVEGIDFIKRITPMFNVESILYSNYTIGLSVVSLFSIIFGLFSNKKENKFLSLFLMIFLNIPIFIYILNGNLYFRNKVLIPFIPLIGVLLNSFLIRVYNRDISIKKLIGVGILVLYMTILTTNGESPKFVLWGVLGLDIVFTIIVICLYKYKKINRKSFSIFIIVPSVLILVFSNCFELYVSRDLLSKIENPKINREIDRVLKSDPDIVRTNNLDDTVYTLNRIYSGDYHQDSVYSSVSNRGYQKFYQKIFKEALPYRNKLMFPQNNDILFQTFMGVKYIYTTGSVPIGYHRVSDNLYRNDNVLPVFYGTSNIISSDDFKRLDYPNNISALLSGAVVSNEVSTKGNDFAIENINLDYELLSTKGVSIKQDGDKLEVRSKSNGRVRVKVNNLSDSDILILNLKIYNKQYCDYDNIDQRITINNVSNVKTCNRTFYQNNNKVFHYVLSANKKLEYLDVVFNKGVYKIGNISSYKLNYRSLDKIKDNQSKFIPDSKVIGDSISGKIDMNGDGYFVTSIPYDDGFRVMVDGRRVNIKRVNRAFLGFRLNSGKHRIVINYEAKYQREGMILSGIGLVGLILLIIYDWRK